MTWTPAALLPGLWVAALLAALGWILRRAFDAVPRAAWAGLAVLLAVLLGPALFGGRSQLPLGYLERFAPFARASAPGSPRDGAPDAALERRVGLQGDLVLQIAPWSMRVRAAYADGAWPLWNPYAGAGEPLWSNPQSQSLQPLQIASLLLPVVSAASVLAALRIGLAFVFTALFLRRFGVGTLAAVGGATVFALGGYLQGWLGWPLASTAGYLALLLYAWLRVEQVGLRRDTLLLAAAGFGLLTAGHPESALHAALLLLLFAVARAARVPAATRWRLARAALLAAALASSLASPLLLPAARALAASQRAAQLTERHARLQDLAPLADPRDGASPWARVAVRAALLAAPLAAGDNFRGSYWGDRNVINDTAGFTGTAALLLFILALMTARGSPAGVDRPRPEVAPPFAGRLVLLLGALAAAVVIARPPGLVQAFNFVPILRSSASFHSRLALWLDFGVAVAAALMLERLFTTTVAAATAAEPAGARAGDSGRLPSRRVIVLAASALAVVVLAATLALDRPELRALRLAAACGQLAILAAATFVLGWRRGRIAALVLLLLCALEPLVLRFRANPSAPQSAFYPPSPAVDYVRARLRPGQRAVGLAGAWRAIVPTVYELADPRLNDPAKPADYVEALAAIRRGNPQSYDELGRPASPLYGLLGVRFALVPPVATLPPPFALAAEFPGARVYERAGSLPLLFWPAAVESCAQGRGWSECTGAVADFGALAMVRDPGPRPLPWRETAPITPVAVALAPTSVGLGATLGEERLLASSVYQDGGWRLLLDGSPRPTTLANGPFVAAWLPAGVHAIDLLYRPPGFVAGMLLAACALAVGGAWAAAPRSRARSQATTVASA